VGQAWRAECEGAWEGGGRWKEGPGDGEVSGAAREEREAGGGEGGGETTCRLPKKASVVGGVAAALHGAVTRDVCQSVSGRTCTHT